MDSNTSKVLLALSETDTKFAVAETRRREIQKTIAQFQTDLKTRREQLSSSEAALKDGKLRHSLEEHRLKDEETKIVERRRQLTDLGGAKSGKFMERELDIATRSLGMLEENLKRAAEESLRLEDSVQSMRTELESLEAKFENESKEWEAEFGLLDSQISELGAERERLAQELEARIRSLYMRVRGRYPAGAVAQAVSGSCRSCFRSLPPQTFNQIIAGSALIQCPGCSRILVAGAQAAEA